MHTKLLCNVKTLSFPIGAIIIKESIDRYLVWCQFHFYEMERKN